MNWREQIAAQIEELRSRAGDYGGNSLDYIAETMQALLDVAVAMSEGPYDQLSTWEKQALDKLREVGDE